ncbi:MAG: hypothetical protein ACO3CD_07365 [Candidatus Nanopelagicaceae bacterium]
MRDVLVDALDQKRDDLVGDLFELYNQVRIRVDNDAKGGFTFNIPGYPDMSTTPETIDYLNGLGDIKISSTGADVISFGDYSA